MSIPKDLAKKRDEDAEILSSITECEPLKERKCLVTGYLNGFNAGVLAALSSEHVLALVEALEKIKYVNTPTDSNTLGVCREIVRKSLACWSKRNE